MPMDSAGFAAGGLVRRFLESNFYCMDEAYEES